MNFTKNNKKKQANNQISTQENQANFFEKVETLSKGLKSYTWRDLETNGKFGKNEKLAFIKEDTLIVGCDIGSETHYIRAIDFRGIELGGKAFSFSNDEQGFQEGMDYLLEIAATSNKKQIVFGLEPTGHYWVCLAVWMIKHGVTVVQVNPYAVKQTKEIEDNSQLKDDRKDPKLIANLVKDGNYGIPYIPEDVYADIRELSLLKDQVSEDHIRCVNRLHRELKRHFPEYAKALSKIDGKFTTELLKKAPLPCDMVAQGEDGIESIWKDAKLRGRRDAKRILEYAAVTVGLTEGKDAARESIMWYAEQIQILGNKLESLEEKLAELCMRIENSKNLLEISGVGLGSLTGILSQLGDISRFDDVKEIQKLSGLGLVGCSSGKHKGETKISYRGRKKLRYWLFQAAKSVVNHADEFRQIHEHYTTRQVNPLKKMQSLIAIACKLLRVIYAILRTGNKYDPEKMIKDIKREAKTSAVSTAA